MMALSLPKYTESPPTQTNTSSSLPSTPQPTNMLLFPPYWRELLPTVLRTAWYERGHMWRRPSIRMATQSTCSILSVHHLGRTKRRRMILYPVSPFCTSRWLGFCRILMSKSTWSPSGHSEESSPIERTAFLMVISPILCIRSIVVMVMPAMLVRRGEHLRPAGQLRR